MTDKYFYDQLPEEKIYFIFGKHWFFLTAQFAIYAAILILLILSPFLLRASFGGAGGENTLLQALLLTGYVLTLIFIHRFFLWLLSYCATFAIVTNYRVIVIKKSMFLKSEKEVLDLAEIRDIQMRKKGLFCNILNCGDINFILSTQEQDATVIRMVHNPTDIQAKCNTVRHQRVQEGKGLSSGNAVSLSSPTIAPAG